MSTQNIDLLVRLAGVKSEGLNVKVAIDRGNLRSLQSKVSVWRGQFKFADKTNDAVQEAIKGGRKKFISEFKSLTQNQLIEVLKENFPTADVQAYEYTEANGLLKLDAKDANEVREYISLK